jgi:hypothetical protein
MKKIALIFITILIYYNSQSQTEKGGFQVGIGGLPIIYPDNSGETGYSLRANFGYFPINKLTVGVMPFVGKVEDMKSIGANIYLRYYLTNKRFSLFVEASGGFGDLKYEDSPQYNGTMNSIIFGPGIHYIFKNNLSIEFIFQYARLRNISYPENTFIGNTLIPTLGIQYFIFK